MGTCNVSVCVQCKFMCEDSGDINFMLITFQILKYVQSYSLAKCMMTVLPQLYKFSGMRLGYVCVQICRAQKLLHIYICVYVLALYVALSGNYVQCSTVNKVMKDVDCYRYMHDIAGCHM